jgi:hypothetical protein
MAGLVLFYNSQSSSIDQAASVVANTNPTNNPNPFSQFDDKEKVKIDGQPRNSSVNSTTTTTTIQATPAVSAAPKGPDWKEKFNGTWHVVRQKDGDQWFSKMTTHNMIIRKLAISTVMSLQKTIEIKGNVLTVERSFGGKKKYWKESLVIGKDKNTAEDKISTLDGDEVTVRTWCDDVKQLLFMYFEPKDKINGSRLLHTRRINEDGELEMVNIIYTYSSII